jgi:hypothetical protein
MGKKKDAETRTHFSEETTRKPTIKSDYRKCKHCQEDVLDTVQKMKFHLAGCKKHVEQLQKNATNPRSISIEHVEVLNNGESKAKKLKQAVLAIPSLSLGDKMELEILYARAIHRNAQEFDLHASPEWKAFFNKLNPAFKLPTPEVIGSSMLSMLCTI